MKTKSYLSLLLFLMVALGITGCSLDPGEYNQVLRFSENSGTFDEKWNDQTLSDQTLHYTEVAGGHKYYLLFATTDLKDKYIQDNSMFASIKIFDATTTLAPLLNVPLISLQHPTNTGEYFTGNTQWMATIDLNTLLPTLDDTDRTDVQFQILDATGIYKTSAHSAPITGLLTENGFVTGGDDTKSNKFQIKALVDSTVSDCTTKTDIIFLESGDDFATTDCRLKTKVAGNTKDYDLYIKETPEMAGLSGISTTFNILSDSVAINPSPFGVDLNTKVVKDSANWFKVSNMLSESNMSASDLSQLRDRAYKHITFALDGGATFNVELVTGTSDEYRCCHSSETVTTWKKYEELACGLITNFDNLEPGSMFNNCVNEGSSFNPDYYKKIYDNEDCSHSIDFNNTVNYDTGNSICSSQTITFTNPECTASTTTLADLNGCSLSENNSTHVALLDSNGVDTAGGTPAECIAHTSETCTNSYHPMCFSGHSYVTTVDSYSCTPDASLFDTLETIAGAAATTTTETITVASGIEGVTSDPFAIRPDHFTLTMSDAFINAKFAGEEFNGSLSAYNLDGTTLTKNYTTTLESKDFYTSFTPDGTKICNTPEIGVDNIELIDGTYPTQNVNNLYITDIANSAMNLQMWLKDDSWTQVDSENGDCGAAPLVACEVSMTPYALNEVKPYTYLFLPLFGIVLDADYKPVKMDIDGDGTLDVIPIFIQDHTEASFTYLDATLTQSLDINFSLQASSKRNTLLKNFNTNCLADATDITISHKDTPLATKYTYAIQDENGVWQKQGEYHTSTLVDGDSDKIVIPLTSANFTANDPGKAQVGIRLNFERDSSKAINPFTFTFTGAKAQNTLKDYMLFNYPIFDNSFSYPFFYASSQTSTIDNSSNINEKTILVDYNIFCDRTCQNNSSYTDIIRSAFSLSANETFNRHQNSLWWIKNPKHQVFDTFYDGTLYFKHGGVQKVNDHNLSYSAVASSSIDLLTSTTDALEALTNIQTTSYHDNNTTVVKGLYNTTKGYPFQKSVNITVNPWLQYNPFGITTVTHRVDLRYTKEVDTTNETLSDTIFRSDKSIKKENSRRIHW